MSFIFIPVLTAFLSIVLGIYPNTNIINGKKEEPLKNISPVSLQPVNEPKFLKEGELAFLNKKTMKKIGQIDIEIADTPREIAAGLMNRRSMPDTSGMLFIFKHIRPWFFWMRNTHIPLDMIFVDKDMQIVMIEKNTKPLSDERIPLHRDTLYTIEVKAGFCDKHGIDIGDFIDAEILNETLRSKNLHDPCRNQSICYLGKQGMVDR